ncbi:MAG: ribosome recycling factor [Candidatus Peregrinibacteria bacterium]|nr:ribosome recycling factor [Candidatus Peregrinibacteria bacterium]MDZ4245054.1 ribosome recycling factor [Candidatus Gracilibacteria bacterium]
MSVSETLKTAEEAFAKCFEHLKLEFGKLRIGRASSSLVEDLHVEVYGGSQALKAIASVSIPDAMTISIKPWDKSVIGAIDKAIRESDIGLNPNNNGESILLNIPPLTEERRKELVKVVHKMAEEAKITIRTKRQDAMTVFKNREKDKEISEDERTGAEKKLQDKVDAVNGQIDDLSRAKEVEVMKL